METQDFSEHFSLFNTASPETVEWVLSHAEEQEYPKGSAIAIEETWGRSVFFIISGWVKIRSSYNTDELTLEILSEGDCFGEMAVLDEAPRDAEAIALSDVKLLSISAQRFIQMLFKDAQLQHRLLQQTVRKVRQFYDRFQSSHQPSKVKLIKTLIALADNYGQPVEKGTEILEIPTQDLADISAIPVEETTQIIESLQSKGWLEIDGEHHALYLTNLKQLSHFAKQL